MTLGKINATYIYALPAFHAIKRSVVIKLKPKAKEGGKIIVPIVTDIHDYIYRGEDLEDFSPSLYKMTVSRVSRKL